MPDQAGKIISPTWRERSYEVLLPLFAATLHLCHFLCNPFPARDTLTYLHALHCWNETGSMAAMLEQFPRFGLLLFTFLPLKWAEAAGIPLFPASVVWTILMSAVSVWALYRIVLLLTCNRVCAAWSGALLAAHPLLLKYAGNLLRDTPYLMFCLLLILWFILAMRTKKRRYFLLSGVALAFTLLSRFEAWEMAVLFPLFSLFYLIRNRFSGREAAVYAACTISAFLATVALMLTAVDDLSCLYVRGSAVVNAYLPEVLRW